MDMWKGLRLDMSTYDDAAARVQDAARAAEGDAQGRPNRAAVIHHLRAAVELMRAEIALQVDTLAVEALALVDAANASPDAPKVDA